MSLEIQTSGEFNSHEYAIALNRAVREVEMSLCRLPDWVLNLDGMSGRKYRCLINILLSQIKAPRYLEIGCWKGSTLISAIWGNLINACVIDNWSGFGGPRNIFYQNLFFFRDNTPANATIRIIEEDFRRVDFASIGKFNAYMFDGPHLEQDQYDGITKAQSALDDLYILIVDDWNWVATRNGTNRAIKDLNLTLLAKLEIRTTQDESHPEPHSQNSDWHNGYFIGICKK